MREAVSDWLAQAESIKSRLETETEHLGNKEEIQYYECWVTKAVAKFKKNQSFGLGFKMVS